MKSTKNSNDEVSAFANAGGEIGQYDNFNCDAQTQSNFEEEADIVKTKPMKLAGKVQEWLNHLEWNDEINLDEENQTSSVSFYYSIKNQSFKVWIETDEKRDVLKFYFYAPFNALANKLNDCETLFNYINACSKWGAITCTDTQGTIRWRHCIDFEGTDPSIATINNAFNVGNHLFEHWFDEITTTALTKTCAKDIIDQLTNKSEPELIEEVMLEELESNFDKLETDSDSEQDALYDEAIKFVTESRKASISSIQRQFKIGYNRAAVIVEAMVERGILSESDTDNERIVLAPPPI